MSAATPAASGRHLACVLALPLALAGCLGPRGGDPNAAAAGAESSAAPAAARPAPSKDFATIRDDVPLPLTKLLHRPPPEVEAELGPPPGKGYMKKSCVRFAPKRVFFECSYVNQTYADATGTFDSVTIGFEDGLSTRVSFNGLPGAGPLTRWEDALAVVGLELPNPPQTRSPDEGVTLWSWYNGAARLLYKEQQYRVEVSVVDGDPKRARVDVILNHPLTPEQEAKIIEVKPREGDVRPSDGTPPA
ncbi:MAG: hypothetical protein R3A79_03055 [Nannocystaceae bacterium]